VTTKVTITKRLATTAYDYGNRTILDVWNLSDPVPTNYTSDLFFPVFDKAFPLSEDASWLPDLVKSHISGQPSIMLETLKQLMAVPILAYNVRFSGIATFNLDLTGIATLYYSGFPENSNRSAEFAKQSYKVIVL
jgi:hypothetical protein